MASTAVVWGIVAGMTDAEQEALDAQLAEMRERLLGDAAANGTTEQAVLAAVDEVVAGYGDARVKSFVAVLVEREVRTRLGLRSAPHGG